MGRRCACPTLRFRRGAEGFDRFGRLGDQQRAEGDQIARGARHRQAPADPDLTAEVRKAILELRRRNRAITREDFVALALEVEDDLDPTIGRARARSGWSRRCASGPVDDAG